MSYRIEYDYSVGKYEIRPVHFRFFPVLVIFAAITLICVLLHDSQVLDYVRALLIPGEDAVTLQALQCMTNDLRSGATLYEAVYDFCRIVIHGV